MFCKFKRDVPNITNNREKNCNLYDGFFFKQTIKSNKNK